jgi:hypothetical protein
VVSLSNHTENLPFDKLRANGIETIPEYFQENLTALAPGGHKKPLAVGYESPPGRGRGGLET